MSYKSPVTANPNVTTTYILLTLIIITLGCSRENAKHLGSDLNDPIGGKEINADCREADAVCKIYPLALGNSWTFERKTYNDSGIVTKVETLIDSIERDTIIEDERWFFMSPVWLTNRNDGVYYFYGQRLPEVLYKYPAQVGDPLACINCAFNNLVYSTDTTLSHDLGPMYCYEYMTVYGWGDTSYSFVAPGIGPVKSMTYWRTNETANRLGSIKTLIKYNLE